jgi:hypothetical protein
MLSLNDSFEVVLDLGRWVYVVVASWFGCGSDVVVLGSCVGKCAICM